MIEEIKDKICLCVNNGYRKKGSKKFDTYEDLLKWTQEQIEESKINIGDNVKIINEGKMYTTLGTIFFTDAYWAVDEITEGQMFDIIRYYQYNPHRIYEGIDKATVEAEYDGKYILSIPSNVFWHKYDYIVIAKEGVKKVNA